ncbi:hypothetical protein [Bacillus haynesii]|uniref:hypothetical protein n=1 Tax=Bacillus haynesii TaxID=1925021 RepID=UPI0022801F6B|nr:hypothetical protein [Bacillus haynesii]MCY9372451.1 hypothetical protein [Bacillus haynesii]MEC0720572.1 hypothetical protein [Bacillus haynesii]
MDAEMRGKPIVTGKDVERFLKNVITEKLKPGGAQRKKLIQKASAAISQSTWNSI